MAKRISPDVFNGYNTWLESETYQAPEILWFITQVVDLMREEAGDDMPQSSFTMRDLSDLFSSRQYDLKFFTLHPEWENYVNALDNMVSQGAVSFHEEIY